MFDANKLLNQMLGAGPAATSKATSVDSPMDQIGGLFGALMSDSVSGMKEGAAAIEKQTGVGAKTDSAIRGATGRSAGDIVEQVKAFAMQNTFATTAALGGLGAMLVGTRGGRGILGSGVALGGLAVIGGLAFKAFQDFQAKAKPAAHGMIAAPPADSPFGETGDSIQDNDTAMLILRAMIAAAACDGMIDSEERSRIIEGLEDAGLDTEAATFLDHEFAKPASIAELAAAARTKVLATEVYTAARIAIDPNSLRETAFLTELSKALKLEPSLAAQIDAAASGAKFH